MGIAVVGVQFEADTYFSLAKGFVGVTRRFRFVLIRGRLEILCTPVRRRRNKARAD